MTWHAMVWYDMVWYDILWYDMIWSDMIWNVLVLNILRNVFMIWYIIFKYYILYILYFLSCCLTRFRLFSRWQIMDIYIYIYIYGNVSLNRGISSGLAAPRPPRGFPRVLGHRGDLKSNFWKNDFLMIFRLTSRPH